MGAVVKLGLGALLAGVGAYVGTKNIPAAEGTVKWVAIAGGVYLGVKLATKSGGSGGVMV